MQSPSPTSESKDWLDHIKASLHRCYDAADEAPEPEVVDEASHTLAALERAGVGEQHLGDWLRMRDKIDGNSPWAQRLAMLTKGLGHGFLIGLHGPRGTGKTLLATFLLARAVHVCSRKYWKTMGLMLDIKSQFARRDKTEKEVIERVCNLGLLVLDEFQVRLGTDYENAVLTHIIDERYRHQKDTLIITNLRPEEFLRDIDTSVASRLVQKGGLVAADWPPFRQPDGILG